MRLNVTTVREYDYAKSIHYADDGKTEGTTCTVVLLGSRRARLSGLPFSGVI